MFDFIMSDVYNFISRFHMRWKNLVDRLTCHMPPISLDCVHILNNDVTLDYLDDKKWKSIKHSHHNELVHVTWSYGTQQYKYAYTMDNPIEFPPYTVEELRTKKPTQKIIASNSNNDVVKHDIIMQYAGPLHNFYCDKISKYMRCRWIHEDCNSIYTMNMDMTQRKFNDYLVH